MIITAPIAKRLRLASTIWYVDGETALILAVLSTALTWATKSNYDDIVKLLQKWSARS
jgi:hypothetical protein